MNIPDALSEVTLGQRIEFHHEFGADLEAQALSILNLTDVDQKELDAIDLQYTTMLSLFSYFSGTPMEAMEDPSIIDTITAIYYNSCLPDLVKSEDKMEHERIFLWKGEIWVLPDTTLKQGDPMTFGELIDSKQIVKDMLHQGAGKWEVLKFLAAIYLRKEGEAFEESFLYEDSERLQLMDTLPMDIARHVSFFLTCSTTIYYNISLYFSPHVLKVVGSIALSTLNDGDGLTSSKKLRKPRCLILRHLPAILL